MNKLSGLFQGDRIIWIIFFALILISVVEVFSALSTLTYQSGDYLMPIMRHTGFLVMGFAVVLIIHRIPCRYFQAWPALGIPFSIITLVMLLTGFGVTINNGARWIPIFGVPVQPSEFAKGTLVIYTAFVLSRNQTDKGATPRSFMLILVPTLIFCGLILPENFSTAAMLFAVIVTMMFIGRVSLITIGKMLSIIAIVGLAAVYITYSLPSTTAKAIGHLPLCKRVPTWHNRLVKHFDSETKVVTAQTFDIDADAQIGHSKIAIASSNVIGKGPGNSVQRDFVPQAYSDFIYSIIVEELGLIGAVFVVILYTLLLFRVGYIAKHFTASCFPPFLAMGLAILLVVQAMANMLVATGLIPVTGQPLPLISRGGTSTLVNCAYIGMILSISRLAKKQDRRRRIANAQAYETPDEYAEDYTEEIDDNPGDTEDYTEIPPAEQTAREIAAGNFGESQATEDEEKQ